MRFETISSNVFAVYLICLHFVTKATPHQTRFFQKNTSFLLHESYQSFRFDPKDSLLLVSLFSQTAIWKCLTILIQQKEHVIGWTLKTYSQLLVLLIANHLLSLRYLCTPLLLILRQLSHINIFDLVANLSHRLSLSFPQLVAYFLFLLK